MQPRYVLLPLFLIFASGAQDGHDTPIQRILHHVPHVMIKLPSRHDLYIDHTEVAVVPAR